MNNVVGKMLIVMQLVFSILFMCFAGAVYTFQGQWRDKAQTLTEQLEVARKQTTVAQEAYETDTKSLKADKQQAEQERDRMIGELRTARDEVESTTLQLAEERLARNKAKADAEVATTEAAARVDESAALNKEVQSLRGRIAELRKELQVMEDKLLDGQGRIAGAEEMEEQLLVEVANLKDLLRLNDIDPRASIPAGGVPQQIEKVDGFVKKSRRNKARTQELIEITIGSDDRIHPNMMLTVYRNNDYVCQVRVMEVYPDLAICVVDERTRHDNVEEGDNVTTKL